MSPKIKRIISVLCICLLTGQVILSQSYTSRNSYTGDWETPQSWTPEWPVPQTSIFGLDITINGYITVNGDLTFLGTASKLQINDTLVIKGNLTLGNNNDLAIGNNGILIVRGKVSVGDNSTIASDGYFIIASDFTKNGSIDKGLFTSNDNPVKVFICGTISPEILTSNNSLFTAINCLTPLTTRYPGSNCSYGNLTDLINDPIYAFYQSTCTATTPAITPGGPTTFCEGGSVTLTSSSGASYLWSTGATTPSIIADQTGSYTVKVTNAGGCMSAHSTATVVTVNSLPATPVITADGPTTFCAGGSVNLASGPASSYLWSSGATTRMIDVTAGGSYTLRITDANGCQSNVSSATIVKVNPLPLVDAGADMTIPNGTNTVINATVSGTGPFAYSWTPAGQLVNPLVEDPTTLNLPVTTVFTLKASSIATSCYNTDAVIINISGGPLSVAPVSTPGTICAGETVQLYAIASGGSGSNTYTWTSTPAGFTSSQANPTVSPVVSTIYKVTVFDGFNTVTSTVPVTVNALPSIPVISASGPTSFCAGSSVTLTSSAGATYLWSTGETTSGINVNSAGTYTVQVTNANGCTSLTPAAITVNVNALPAVPVITASGPTTFCEGGSTILTSSPEAGYLWSTGSTSASIIANASGNYSVQVTNTAGCKSAVSVPTIVTINALPGTPVVISSGPTNFCAGGTVTLSSSGGIGFIWSNSETTQSINVTTSGTYSVKLTNIEGCQSKSSSPSTVTVNALPVANPGPDQILESEFETSMSAQLSSSETGEWFLISGTSQIDDKHSPTSRLTELASGENVFLWKVSNGNCEDSAKVRIMVNGVLVPSVITPDGDGKNDYFRINKTDGKMKLIIINKWGNEEFSNTNYLNDWNGRNNKGSELPADTYFYILIIDNTKIIKGSVLIKR